jgi:cytoskeletal protein CcmA (bactofilin family)
MSIFRRENNASTAVSGASSEPSSHSQRRGLTHIAPGTVLRGEVAGSTELLIEGEIQGQVRVGAAVTVGAEGAVEGPIAAPVVRIAGRVIGDVAATDRVEVTPSGSLEGDIRAPRVVVAEGAFFKGRVEMRGDQAGGSRGPGPKLATESGT